jgi:hypothetical protein
MTVAVVPQTEPAKPVDWDREITGARMLLKSGLLPKSVGSAEAAMFIILAGRDLGLSPVQSLRSINVIQGKVEVAADMQLGLFHRAGGKSHWVKLTNEEAVLQLAAPWLIESHTESFTLEDAKRARLAGDNWQKYPKAMLRSRAITAGLKSVGFDPTAGVFDYGEMSGAENERPAEAIEVEQVTPITENGQVHAETEELAFEAEEQIALRELEALIPDLPFAQQQWAREKLSDGSDPSQVLGFLKSKVGA